MAMPVHCCSLNSRWEKSQPCKRQAGHLQCRGVQLIQCGTGQKGCTSKDGLVPAHAVEKSSWMWERGILAFHFRIKSMCFRGYFYLLFSCHFSCSCSLLYFQELSQVYKRCIFMLSLPCFFYWLLTVKPYHFEENLLAFQVPILTNCKLCLT